MPRLAFDCRRCGRAVDTWQGEIRTENGSAVAVWECADRERCDRPWSGLDRLANATIGQLLSGKLATDPRLAATQEGQQ